MTARSIFYRVYQTRMHLPHWCKNGKTKNGPLKPSSIEGAISDLLKWLRIEGTIPWEAIVDEQRYLSGKVGFSDVDEFIQQEMTHFLSGYRRCLAKKQHHYLEVWLEKATLRHIVQPIADKYCRRLMCCKGYNSVTFQNAFYDRAMEAISRDQVPVILYFGDWDPSGCNMLYAAAQTLIDELGLFGTHFYRCGINPEHFESLPNDPVPVKSTDSRARNFIKKYGRTAYELDAFEPEALQGLVEQSILKFTDVDSVHVDLDQEPIDLDFLRKTRAKVHELIRRELG